MIPSIPGYYHFYMYSSIFKIKRHGYFFFKIQCHKLLPSALVSLTGVLSSAVGTAIFVLLLIIFVSFYDLLDNRVSYYV